MYCLCCSIDKEANKIDLSLRESDTGYDENIPKLYLGSKRPKVKVEPKSEDVVTEKTPKKRKRKSSASKEDKGEEAGDDDGKKSKVEVKEEERDSGVEVKDEVESDPEVKLKVICIIYAN